MPKQAPPASKYYTFSPYRSSHTSQHPVPTRRRDQPDNPIRLPTPKSTLRSFKKNDEVTLLDRPIYDNAGRKVTAQKLGLEGVTYLECDVAYAKEIRKEFLEAETDGRSVREGKILLLWMCYQKYPSLFW